ncbi:diguanylate cyclase [Billgrantia kenyensis]|uniref:diguanylate cyclase n=1 Tax=Billgrantia kenyensis TaxID=321266 RepID=A0A7V9W3G4_9GAMM|nr:GGDEF domain-containing protein [Halomonas kenyensis]MCG6663198.1 GGDEF domain-containing protein [Halomonas kenyensis]
MSVLSRLQRTVDPLHGATHEEKSAFDTWYLQAKIPLIRYIALLTALLYFIYAAVQVSIAPNLVELRIALHGFFVPFLLVTISAMTLSSALYRPMVALLMVAPVLAAIASLYLNVGQGQFPLYAPELYLILIWTFTTSGLRLCQAAISASSALVVILATTILVPQERGFLYLHLLYILAAFSFGILNALILEKAHKAMFLQQRRLAHLASVDGLTGLWNRHTIEALFDEECERASRYGTPLSVILLDIDHFKQVNDKHGHIVGDSVLKQFASLLRDNLRSVDQVGRLGGEEFLIVLPETDLLQAQAAASLLQERISALDFARAGHCTASFGVTQYHPDEERLVVINRADRALYKAKAKGRNRIEVMPCTVDGCKPCAAIAPRRSGTLNR